MIQQRQQKLKLQKPQFSAKCFESRIQLGFLNTIMFKPNRNRYNLGGQYILTESKDEINIRKGPKHRILVVDDNYETNLFFKMTLEQEGFYVETYSDPLEVVQAFKPEYFDLLLLDIRMPHMNGFELYELLKEIDKSIKVCFITGFESYYKSLSEEFDLDVNCFIRKPVKKDELIKHVFELLVTSE